MMQHEGNHDPEIKFIDHVAIAVKQGDLEGQVSAYKMLGFREIHREDVLGSDLSLNTHLTLPTKA